MIYIPNKIYSLIRNPESIDAILKLSKKENDYYIIGYNSQNKELNKHEFYSLLFKYNTFVSKFTKFNNALMRLNSNKDALFFFSDNSGLEIYNFKRENGERTFSSFEYIISDL